MPGTVLMTRRRWITLLLVAALAFAAGCGGEKAAGPATPASGTPPAASPSAAATPGTPIPPSGIGADVPANLFQNGGFESGYAPWVPLTPQEGSVPPKVTSARAHSGKEAALLMLSATPEDTGSNVYGFVQELSPPAEFPEVISGYYRVEGWVRGAPKQYLEFVVAAVGAKNIPGGHVNPQTRYVLAGVSEPPLDIPYVKYVFLSRQDPPTDQWVYFEVPIRKDFEEQWGAVPEGYEKLEVFFEARYDDKPAGAEASANVFYDDLYIGPAQGDPNRP